MLIWLTFLNLDSHGRAQFAELRLTYRALAEATWQYGKIRDAEQDLKHIEGNFQKQAQYFDSNPRMKESLESQRSRAENRLKALRSDYVTAAREVEPILVRLNSEPPSPKENIGLNEEATRRIVETKVKDLEHILFRGLDSEIDNAGRKIRQDLSHDLARDIRTAVNKELKSYVPRTEHERLVGEIRNPRGRQSSVSSDTARDYDQRIVAHARELETLKAELTTRTNRQSQELSSLKDRVNSIQKEPSLQRRIQTSPPAKSDDILKVYSLYMLISSHRWKLLWRKLKKLSTISTLLCTNCNFKLILSWREFEF
jgi:hypothetical protein